MQKSSSSSTSDSNFQPRVVLIGLDKIPPKGAIVICSKRKGEINLWDGKKRLSSNSRHREAVNTLPHTSQQCFASAEKQEYHSALQTFLNLEKTFGSNFIQGNYLAELIIKYKKSLSTILNDIQEQKKLKKSLPPLPFSDLKQFRSYVRGSIKKDVDIIDISSPEPVKEIQRMHSSRVVYPFQRAPLSEMIQLPLSLFSEYEIRKFTDPSFTKEKFLEEKRIDQAVFHLALEKYYDDCQKLQNSLL